MDLDVLVLAPAFAAYSEGNNGQPVPLYTPPGGGAPSAIDGIFRMPSANEFGIGDSPGMTTRKPELDVRVSQVPPGVAICQGGTFAVRGIAYSVTDVRPDGEGLISLELAEAPVS